MLPTVLPLVPPDLVAPVLGAAPLWSRWRPEMLPTVLPLVLPDLAWLEVPLLGAAAVAAPFMPFWSRWRPAE